MKYLRRIILVAVALLVIKIALGLRPPHLGVPPLGIVLTQVTVINPGRDRHPNQTIIVRGNTIEQISEGGPPPGRLHPFTRRYRQSFVLPGLIDSSTYQPAAFPGLRQAFGVYFLFSGVTTVRDIGNFDGDIAASERDVREGRIGGPRLVACGRVLEGDPPLCTRSRVVRTATEAEPAVAELASAGARCIRVQWTLRADVLAAVRAAATTRGLPVVGDAPLESGLNGATPNDVELVSAVRPLARPSRRSDFLAAWLSLDGAAVDTLVAASLLQRVAYTVALLPWLQLGRTFSADGPIDAHAHFLPRAYREVIWETQAGTALASFSGSAALGARSETQGFDHALFIMQDTVRRLHQAGVPLHAGSGTPRPFVIPGVGAKLALGALVGAGLSLDDAWVALTRDAGAAVGIAGLGTIEPGAPADLLLFREDPTQSFAALETLEAVVSQGRLYTGQHLLRSMLEQVRYFEQPVYDWVSVPLARLWVSSAKDEWTDCLTP